MEVLSTSHIHIPMLKIEHTRKMHISYDSQSMNTIQRSMIDEKKL